MSRTYNFRAWDKKLKRYEDFTNHKDGLLYQDGKMYVSSGWDSYDNPTFDDCDTERYIIEQFTGLTDKNGVEIYEGDYCIMDCWDGGDGINEPSNHDDFEGVVVYDQKICRWGLQTELCDEGQIEVGLEDNIYTTIEVIGNVHTEKPNE